MMFTKSNFLAALLGGIFIFLGGFIIWGGLLANFFAQHAGSATGVARGEPDIMYTVIGSFVEAFFMSTLYGRWANRNHTLKNGFEFGFILGALFGFGEGLIQFSVNNVFDLTAVLVNGITTAIFMGLAGIIISLGYKSTSD